MFGRLLFAVRDSVLDIFAVLVIGFMVLWFS